VTIQAQILELMVDLQDKYSTAIIMITHDLGVVSQLADKVMVMYAGRAVEQATTDEVFYDPLMPYSWSLLRSLPRPGYRGRGEAPADRRHAAQPDLPS
jgi:oligopeptide transport system ATP-binding protein